MRRSLNSIAIIGGGAAGCSAAYALSKVCRIRLFEAASRPGGHAWTHELPVNGRMIPIDMGVEYFHERVSPNLCALLQQFGLESYIAPLSFRAFQPEDPHAFWSNARITGSLRKALHKEMNRFHQDMAGLLQGNVADVRGMSIREFLDRQGYSETFRLKALLPLMTTFSGCRAPSLDYSLLYFALSFNLNLLSFYTPCHWRKVSGGIYAYFRKIGEAIKDHISLETPVKAVERDGTKCIVTLEDGTSQIFDAVIFACQANIAHQLIRTRHEERDKCLAAFEQVDVQSLLHTDTLATGIQPSDTEYCQFSLSSQPNAQFAGYLTRVIHNLYPDQDLEQPVYVSFDNREQIDPEKILLEKTWKLPKLRPIDMANKQKMGLFQGIDNFWFCGTDYSLTGHEGALVSGLVIACHLGAQYPFKNNWLARAQFDLIRNFMNINTRQQKVTGKLIRGLFNISRQLGLHKHFSGQFVRELFL